MNQNSANPQPRKPSIYGHRFSLVFILLGTFLLGLSIWGMIDACSGLRIMHLKAGDIPFSLLFLQNGDPAERPLVLVGHGFAGSDILMRGFALTLAYGGYTVASWDFDGHGANPLSLHLDSLLHDPESVMEAVRAMRLADVQRVAILGHSMGSGVALEFGQVHPETAAVVAISPVLLQVTPQYPRNLLLMAGSREPRFASNARALLQQAGGAGGELAWGTGRSLVIVKGVEHISILFSPEAHQVARSWLDQTFGLQPDARSYTDWRIIWYGIGVAGTLLLCMALASWLAIAPRTGAGPGALRLLFSLAAGALAATLLLWLFSLAGLQLHSLLGFLVGGYLLVWLGLAGVLVVVFARLRPDVPSRQELFGGLLVFALLWLGVGLSGHFVWLPWLLIPTRLVFWPLGSVLLLPWFLVVGRGFSQAALPGKLAWWLAQTLILLGTLSLALRLNSDLSFILIILPLFPLILGMHALAVARYRTMWVYAISAALIVSWLLLAVFPLA